jgi:hypothetical protein
MKVALCLPIYGDTKARFTLSLIAMVATSLRGHGIDLDTHPSFGGSRVEVARETVAANAIAAGADWLFWLDADQTFPPDTLLRLLAHGLPFVGCNYPKRDVSEAPTAHIYRSGRPVPLLPKAGGVEPVDLMGFGVLLIGAEVFQAVPRPWFRAGKLGEDGHFCEAAKGAGFQPYVDHALSMQVGHIAERELTFRR